MLHFTSITLGGEAVYLAVDGDGLVLGHDAGGGVLRDDRRTGL